MDRLTVSSSDLASVGYDENSQILEIGFLDGSVYQYFDVPKNIYDGILNASSKGTYFHEYIRNVYAYTKLN